MDGSLNVTQTDVLQAVREAAMLADVSIGVFSAERSDANILEKLKRDAGAVGNVGRVVKNILAGADDKLKAVRSAYTHVRTLHYHHTLPWVSDPHAERIRGARLLPHLLLQRYLDALSKQKRVAENLRDEFLADYPNIVAQAKINLANLADQFYPSVDEVRAAFRVHFDFEPIPDNASFRGLDDHMMERLSKALVIKQERMLNQAQAHAWSTVRERVGHLIEKLGDTEAKFKKSTISNVQELAVLLPGWNLTGQAGMTEAAQDIQTMLDGVTPDNIRDDDNLRGAVVSKARGLITKLDQWGV